MPRDFTNWATSLSSLPPPALCGHLSAILLSLHTFADDHSLLHLPLGSQLSFVSAVVSLAAASADAAEPSRLAVEVLGELLAPAQSRELLNSYPGLVSALVASPHTAEALSALQRLLMSDIVVLHIPPSAPLLQLLASSAAADRNGCNALANLCSSGNARALLEHPGLLGAVCKATRERECREDACRLLYNLSCEDELEGALVGNAGVHEALLEVMGSHGSEAPEYDLAANYFFNLSVGQETSRAKLACDGRVISQLAEHAGHEKSALALYRLSYIGVCPTVGDPIDLFAFAARPFRHHLEIARALIRIDPCELTRSNGAGLTCADVASSAGLHEIALLMNRSAEALGSGLDLVHLVGYEQVQRGIASERRRAVMLCLRRLADVKREGEMPGRGGKRGNRRGKQLNAVRAVAAYEVGGEDVWSVILKFAF
ncbi:hypothetical protein TeGR_g12066 [Tetraparma gracilis]|uniref:Uncharacterized protein n=1 Tax=Tetraparma gracilis TaxID=2962635 RepID=A0ABQ6MV61_9STRA|nr:hypothetical protein TeGR_g12066 [Tetraparma gracilis]